MGTIDKELTRRTIDFMTRQTKAKKPFFAFVPYTQPHMPTLPHPDFENRTGNGAFADVLAQMDAYVGELLDSVDQLGIADNTIVVFTSDNGPEAQQAYYGYSGPWRGTYFTGWEGSLRVPFIIRWPGKVPAGTVSNEIVHEMDLFPTLTSIAGAKLPTDRTIDGVDQSSFFFGKTEKSSREGFVVYVGESVFGAKWRNWKVMNKELDTQGGPIKEYGIPASYDLHLDPKEEHPLDPRTPENFWVRFPIAKILTEHAASLKREPPIRPGTLDPYIPPK